MTDLPSRCPGAQVPRAARDAATQAGRTRRAPDVLLLERVRDALLRLPASARGPHYYRLPGATLATPRTVNITEGQAAE
ncbi:MAG TPA: hypothetical protein VH478_23045 [Trebonia sp.]|jgi:hypothetical protein|nr:hypothetical protein [Trebonia sp.]